MDDFLHRFLFLEAKAARAGGGKGAGPAIDDVEHFLVENKANFLARGLPGHLFQGLKNLRNRQAAPWRVDAPVQAQRRGIHRRRVQKPFNGGARGTYPDSKIIRHRAIGLKAQQWLTHNGGNEGRRRLIGPARAHHDGWQAQVHRIQKASAGSVMQQQFANGLLRAIGIGRDLPPIIRHHRILTAAERRN